MLWWAQPQHPTEENALGPWSTLSLGLGWHPGLSGNSRKKGNATRCDRLWETSNTSAKAKLGKNRFHGCFRAAIKLATTKDTVIKCFIKGHTRFGTDKKTIPFFHITNTRPFFPSPDKGYLPVHVLICRERSCTSILFFFFFSKLAKRMRLHSTSLRGILRCAVSSKVSLMRGAQIHLLSCLV